MRLVKGFVGGVLAGAATSFVAACARGLGVSVNLELLLGSALTEHTGVLTWILGFLVYLLIGGLAGFVYAIATLLLRRTGALVGAGLGVLHLLIDGVGLGWLGGSHPLMPAMMAEPGPFLSNSGAEGVFVFVLLHLGFGALVGTALGPASRTRPSPVTAEGAPEAAPALTPTDAPA